jgi:hypothetical protein
MAVADPEQGDALLKKGKRLVEGEIPAFELTGDLLDFDETGFKGRFTVGTGSRVF